MFVVDVNLIKHVKLSTLYTAKLRCRQQIYSTNKFENIVSYYVAYNKSCYSYDEFSLIQFSKHKFLRLYS